MGCGASSGANVVDTVGGPEADAEVKVPSVFRSVYAYRSCVYMYMYTYVDEGFTWMYAMLLCMYVNVCVFCVRTSGMYTRMYVCTVIRTQCYYTRTSAHARAHAPARTRIRAYTHTHQRARAYTRTARKRTHAHTRTRACACVCMYMNNEHVSVSACTHIDVGANVSCVRLNVCECMYHQSYAGV